MTVTAPITLRGEAVLVRAEVGAHTTLLAVDPPPLPRLTRRERAHCRAACRRVAALFLASAPA